MSNQTNELICPFIVVNHTWFDRYNLSKIQEHLFTSITFLVLLFVVHNIQRNRWISIERQNKCHLCLYFLLNLSNNNRQKWIIIKTYFTHPLSSGILRSVSMITMRIQISLAICSYEWIICWKNQTRVGVRISQYNYYNIFWRHFFFSSTHLFRCTESDKTYMCSISRESMSWVRKRN